MMPSPITVMDGGMGTTLETLSADNAKLIATSRLWSADPLLTTAVQEVHVGFLEAGATLIGTSTYQSAQDLYLAEGCTSQEAHTYMRRGVSIAKDAIQSHKGKEKEVREGRIGLCLGPYGATLSPGQEYSGVYPPPFGPFPAPSATLNTTSQPSLPSNTFPSTSSPSLITSSIHALRSFHLDRLRTFALDEPTWRAVEWVCFETAPLLREAVAIRLAMGELYDELTTAYGEVEQAGRRPWWRKKFWVSFVYPQGVAPDGSSVEVQMEAMFHPTAGSLSSYLTSPADGQAAPTLATPDAVGVNCTSPAYISQITTEMTTSVANLDLASRPGLVIYPDGGLVYDPVTRTWAQPTGGASGLESGSSWGRNVAAVAKDAANAVSDGKPGGAGGDVWSEVLVGGCCKAGFEEISSLSAELSR